MNSKKSTLDHIYVKKTMIVKQIKNLAPLVGDHLLIIVEITGIVEKPKVILKRDWRSYSKNLLLTKLQTVQFNVDYESPQDLWNNFEITLLPIVDEIVPYAEFCNNTVSNSNSTPKYIKNKINIRKKLLRKLKIDKTND